MFWAPQYAAIYQHTPSFHLTHPPVTPCIPDSTLYPPSPYSNPGSPNPGGIPLPADPTTPNTPNLELPPVDIWDDNHRHERRPSWQGLDTAHLWPRAARVYSDDAAVHRRHSFGAQAYQPPYLGPGVMSPASLFTPFFINPWIDAESPRSDFFFDVSLPTFKPTQLSADGQSRLFPEEEVLRPATHPPLAGLKIVFDALPKWPCYIPWNSYEPPSTITVYDVLVYLHFHMHTQITHADFADLSPREQIKISRVFTKRCEEIPDNFVEERASGVKRMDYLIGKTRFVGLLRLGREDGWNLVKAVFAQIRK